MHFLKNKHLIMAMFIAPVLAVIAYIAVDNIVSEVPHAAVDGASYKLAAKSNCRYKSGICTLENGDIEVKLRVEIANNKQAEIFLSSELPVQHAVVSFVNIINNYDDGEKSSTEPVAFKLIKNDDMEKSNVWSAKLNTTPTVNSVIRLAVNISGATYYAETTSIFIDYETSFSRENFSTN